MKIISKYKDYYDYLSGVYGVDEKIVLDRTKGEPNPFFFDNNFVDLYVCGYLYQGFYRNNRLYWGEDLKLIAETKPKSYWSGDKYKWKSDDYVLVKSVSRYEYLHIHKTLDENKHNIKANCPIVIHKNTWNDDYQRYPILQNIGVNKIIDAKEIYLMLIEWLSPKDNIQDNRTNKEKITSAGFDLKTSFRNVK